MEHAGVRYLNGLGMDRGMPQTQMHGSLVLAKIVNDKIKKQVAAV